MFYTVKVNFNVFLPAAKTLGKELQASSGETYINSHIVTDGNEKPFHVSVPSDCKPGGSFLHSIRVGEQAYLVPNGWLVCPMHFHKYYPTEEKLRAKYAAVKEYKNVEFTVVK